MSLYLEHICAKNGGQKSVRKPKALAQYVVAGWSAAVQAPNMAAPASLPENPWGNGFDEKTLRTLSPRFLPEVLPEVLSEVLPEVLPELPRLKYTFEL